VLTHVLEEQLATAPSGYRHKLHTIMYIPLLFVLTMFHFVVLETLMLLIYK